MTPNENRLSKLIISLGRSDYPFLITLLTLITITYWRWFFVNDNFIWGDASFFFRFDRHWEEYFGLFRTWSTRSTGLGGYNIVLNTNLIEFLIGAVTKFLNNTQLGLKIFVYIPATIIAPFSAYYLSKHILENRFSAFISAIVYTFNVYILLSNIGGHLFISIAYGIAPLVLLTYIVYVNKPNTRNLLVSGIVSFICSTYEIRIFYILAWIMVFFLGYKTLANYKKPRQAIIDSIKGVFPFIIVMVLSSYWLLPLIFSGSVENNIAVNRGLFGNGNMDLAQSLAFFHPFWTANEGISLERQSIPIHHWLIPIFGLLGIVGYRKNKLLGFFVFVWLLGLLLTKQSGWPFNNLYLWLYENWPGFNAYREASKFYVLLSLGYCVLIGNSINTIHNIFKDKRYLKLSIPFFSSLIIIVFLVNMTSLTTGAAKGLLIPKEIPSEYKNLEIFLAQNYSDYKTLWVPSSSIWSYYDFQIPRIGLYQLYFNNLGSFWEKYSEYVDLNNNSNGVSDINHRILEILTQSYSDNYLDMNSIRFVIVPSETTADSEDDVLMNYGFANNRAYIIDILDNVPYLKRIPSLDGIDIYENENYLPKIVATADENIIDKLDTQISKVGYSSYTISTPSKPEYIYFSDAYDPNWKLYRGEPSTIDILLGNTFEYKNEETTALTNRFNLSSVDVFGETYTLLYKPQIYTNIGTFITTFGITFIIIYLGVNMIHNSRDNG